MIGEPILLLGSMGEYDSPTMFDPPDSPSHRLADPELNALIDDMLNPPWVPQYPAHLAPMPQLDPYAFEDPPAVEASLEPSSPFHSASPSMDSASGTLPRLDAPGLPFYVDSDIPSSPLPISDEQLALLVPSGAPSRQNFLIYYPTTSRPHSSSEVLDGPAPQEVTGETALSHAVSAPSTGYSEQTQAWIQSVAVAQPAPPFDPTTHFAGPPRPAKRPHGALDTGAAQPSSSRPNKNKKQRKASKDDGDADFEGDSSATPSDADWNFRPAPKTGKSKGKAKAPSRKRSTKSNPGPTDVDGVAPTAAPNSKKVPRKVDFAPVGGLYLGIADSLLDYMQTINPANNPHFPQVRTGHKLNQMRHCVLCGEVEEVPRRHLSNHIEHSKPLQVALVGGKDFPDTKLKHAPIVLTMYMLYNSEYLAASPTWDFDMLPWTPEAKVARSRFLDFCARIDDYSQIEGLSLTGQLAPLRPHFVHWAKYCIDSRTCECGYEYARPDAIRRCKDCIELQATEAAKARDVANAV